MARACFAAEQQNALRPYSSAVFQAVFAHGQKVDKSTCIEIADRLTLDEKRFEQELLSDRVSNLVTSAAREALESGAFGVPIFLVDGRIYWGNDRIVLLEQHVATGTSARASVG